MMKKIAMECEVSPFNLESQDQNFLKVPYCIVLMILLLIFSSCSPKIYQKEDYPFYNKSFHLDTSSALRTDGVYVLDHIWTDQNGGTVKKPENHIFYKFYKTGQCNLTVDLSNEIKTEKQYQNVINIDFDKQSSTLFQGYYKISEPKIIIQRRVTPRKLFEYKYGYLEKNTLIIVKSTIDGRGKFDDKYYTGYYKEYYVFVPLETKNEGQPQW